MSVRQAYVKKLQNVPFIAERYVFKNGCIISDHLVQFAYTVPVIMKDSPATKIFHAKVRNTELALQLFMVQTAFCHLPKTWI